MAEFAEEAIGDVVERAAPEAGGYAGGDALGAIEHFAGSAVGEGEQEEFGRGEAALNQVDHTVDQRTRFARTRSGEDEQRPIGGRCGFELLGIEE